MTRRRLVFAALAAATLLISHDAVFLVQLGPGEHLARALRSAGHDYWGVASAVIALAAILAAVVVAVRLRRLSSRAATLGARPLHEAGLVRRAAGTWVRLFAVVAVGFVLQESAEHLVMHAHPIGVGALLGPEYPLALPVILLLTCLAALAVEIIVGVERALLAVIAAALTARLRPDQAAPRRPSRGAAHRAPVLSRRGASRAPPVVVAA